MTRLNSARLDPPCPFCRTPAPFSDKECIDRMKKRMEQNDPEAFHGMGAAVHGGAFGLKQDHTKAAEMLLKAVELGSVRASNSLGDIYYHAEGVKKDLMKARYYFEHAAMGGSEEARYNLARLESGVGNMKRAVKHLMLGAEAGSDWCVEKIKDYFLTGVCTKEEYALAIRAHGACRDEMRSDSRDAAAKMVDELSRNNRPVHHTGRRKHARVSGGQEKEEKDQNGTEYTPKLWTNQCLMKPGTLLDTFIIH